MDFDSNGKRITKEGRRKVIAIDLPKKETPAVQIVGVNVAARPAEYVLVKDGPHSAKMLKREVKGNEPIRH